MKVLACGKLTHNKFVNLFRIHYEHQNRKNEWVYASRREKSQPVTGPLTTPDAVVIAATIQDNLLRDNLVVVKELRPALGGYQYALPAGIVDDGESIEKTAERELKEETGLTLDKIEKVSPILYSSAGLTDESVQIVFCTCSGTIATDGQTENEDITTLLLDKDKIIDLIECKNEFENAMICAKAWQAFVIYKNTCTINDMNWNHFDKEDARKTT